MHKRAAIYVDKILKGAKPADLPIEQPSKFTFIVSLPAAKTLGVTVPSQLLELVDQLIELDRAMSLALSGHTELHCMSAVGKADICQP